MLFRNSLNTEQIGVLSVKLNFLPLCGVRIFSLLIHVCFFLNLFTILFYSDNFGNYFIDLSYIKKKIP